MSWETAAMFVCGIVVAWMVISMLSAIWYGRFQKRQRRARLRIMKVQQLKREGHTHSEAMDLTDEQFP